jgi:hypothetical protein
MAVYSAGQQVTMQWPAKNHALVSNPDRGVQIFFGIGADRGDDFSHINGVDEWCATYPDLCVPFSNCEPNQPGVDRAPCTGTFTIPAGLENGVYSAIWWWEFNEGEYYSSCFDVTITDGGSTFVPPVTTDSSGIGADCTDRPSNYCPLYDVPGLNGIVFDVPPVEIPTSVGQAFDVNVRYSASQNLVLVIDILDGNSNWYGGGGNSEVYLEAGEGTATLNLAISNDLSGATDVVLKAWLVTEGDYALAEPWLYEITVREQSVALGSAALYCTEDACSRPRVNSAFIGDMSVVVLLGALAIM